MPIPRSTHLALLLATIAGLLAAGSVVFYRTLRDEPAHPTPAPSGAVQASTPTAISGLPPCNPDDITLSLRVEPWFGDNLITVESANNGPPCASRILTVSTLAATGLSGPNIWFPGWEMPTGQQEPVQLIWQADCIFTGKAFEVRAELAGREATVANFPAGSCSHGNSASIFPAGKADAVNGVALPSLPSCRPAQLGLGLALEPAIGSVVLNTSIINKATPCRLRGNLSIEVLDTAGPDAVPVYADLDRELTVAAFAWENWCGAPGKFALRLTLGAISTSLTIDPPACGDPRSGTGLRSTGNAANLAPLLDGTVPITCHKRTYGWARPSLEQMRATTFTVPRFHDPIDSGTIYPPLFALYLSHVYYNEVPWANSAQIEPTSMSGMKAPAAGTEKLGPCRYETSRSPTETYSEFWLADYRPVEVRVIGDEAVIRVAPDPGTFHTFDIARPAIIDPKSSTNTPIAMPAPLSLIRVVDDSGRLLHEDSRYLNGWEVDSSGRLVFAEMDTHIGVALDVSFDGRENPGEIAVYSGGNPSGSSTLEVRDRTGNVLATYDLAAASKSWQRLATFTLPRQPVTLHLESAATEGVNFLILPATQELP